MCNDNTAKRDIDALINGEEIREEVEIINGYMKKAQGVYDLCNIESIENQHFYRCKCGEEEEIYEDIEWHVCRLCKRRGCWMKIDNR